MDLHHHLLYISERRFITQNPHMLSSPERFVMDGLLLVPCPAQAALGRSEVDRAIPVTIDDLRLFVVPRLFRVDETLWSRYALAVHTEDLHTRRSQLVYQSVSILQ